MLPSILRPQTRKALIELLGIDIPDETELVLIGLRHAVEDELDESITILSEPCVPANEWQKSHQRLLKAQHAYDLLMEDIELWEDLKLEQT